MKKNSKYIGKDDSGNYYINITKLIYVDEIKALSTKQLMDEYNLTVQEMRDISKELNKHGITIDKRRLHTLILSDEKICKLYSLGMSRSTLASITSTNYRLIRRITKDVTEISNKPNLMKGTLLRSLTLQIKIWVNQGYTHQQISDKLQVIDRSTVSKFIASMNLRKESSSN